MACYTRTGHHAKDTGEWRNGKSLVATFWMHTISRDGDPQLHVASTCGAVNGPEGGRPRAAALRFAHRARGEVPGMSGPGDEITAGTGGHSHLRASRADREQVIDVLKAAFVQERLTKEEFDLRVGQALAPRTYAELAALTADIPARPIGDQPPRTPARVQARPPMGNVAKAGICVAIAVTAAAVMTVVYGGAALFLFVPFYFMALLVAAAQMLASRHEKRSRGQLRPRRAQRGQGLEGEQNAEIGDDRMLSEAHNDVRAGHWPGHEAAERSWRSLPVRPGQRRPAGLQATA
jgi:hypothetical protein